MFDGRSYMLGASASEGEAGERTEWILQIVKMRTFAERLTGRARMAADDACAAFFEEMVRREPDFEDVTVDS